jgi:hypothetical protein
MTITNQVGDLYLFGKSPSGSVVIGQTQGNNLIITGSIIVQNIPSGSTSTEYVVYNTTTKKLETTTGSGGGDRNGLITTGSIVDTQSITGSLILSGTTNITGSLNVSGSGQYDMNLNGQMLVTNMDTNATRAPRIFISGSNGNTAITRNSITTKNTTDNGGIFPSTIFTGDLATSDEIGFTVDPSEFGISGWTKGPAIYVNNDALDSYAAVFGFQNKANYTDGTVTVLRDLDVTGSIDITGQYLVNGVPISGSGGDRNGLITTGSIVDTQQITGSLILGNTVISGSFTLNLSNDIIISSIPVTAIYKIIKYTFNLFLFKIIYH